MNSYTTSSKIGARLQSLKKKKKTIGFVPTMGALHEGHLSLIKRSKAENDITVCSIFVNPTQFTNPGDLTNYPRMLEKDCRLLSAAGCDLLFAPEVDEMYPSEKEANIDLDFGVLGKVLEGKYRPGHFQGVAIIVRKFFDIIRPDRAYFGKKDLQQLAVVRLMVNALAIPVEIVPCETIRESDGLAMSSRNLRLSIGERILASKIYEVLMYTKAHAGLVPVGELRSLAFQRFQKFPEFRVEYIEIIDRLTFLPIESWDQRENAAVCIAAYLGDIRLIDNMELFS